MNIAISGFGRIGRLILRAVYEQNYHDIKVVAINAPRGDVTSNIHLLKYDTAHGKFQNKSCVFGRIYDHDIDKEDLIVEGEYKEIARE